MYEEGLGELGFISLEESRLMGNLIANFNSLMGGWSKGRARLLQRCTVAAGKMPIQYLGMNAPSVSESFVWGSLWSRMEWPKPTASPAGQSRDLKLSSPSSSLILCPLCTAHFQNVTSLTQRVKGKIGLVCFLQCARVFGSILGIVTIFCGFIPVCVGTLWARDKTESYGSI